MKEKKRIGHDDRINIQAATAKGWTLAQTARFLSKSRSTVYREILGSLTYKDCRHSCSRCKKGCPIQKAALPKRRVPPFRGKGMRTPEVMALLLQRCPKAQFCSAENRLFVSERSNLLPRCSLLTIAQVFVYGKTASRGCFLRHSSDAVILSF